MNVSHVYAILLRQFYLMRDNATRVLQVFIWTTLNVIIWGFTTIYLSNATNHVYSFVPTLLGAVLLWEFLTRAMQGVTMPFFEDMWAHNFLNIFASPLTRAEYLLGFVLVSLTTSVVSIVIVIFFASWAFGYSLFSVGVPLILFMTCLFIFGVSLGFVGVAAILRLGPPAEWLVWPIPAFIIPFVGVYYPAASLPPWMHPISAILPPTYVFDGMRSLVLHGALSYSSLAWAIVSSFIYIALSVAFFELVFRRAVRHGLIARYSAESF